MTAALQSKMPAPTPDLSGVEFATSADGLAVARIGDLVLAMADTAGHKRDLAKLNRVQTRMSASTPWGGSQMAVVYAEGVVAHMTSGHGGFHLSSDRNAKVHPLLRKGTPWYEEDCEWAIVAISFPDLFTGYERSMAEKTFRNTWPDAW